MLNFKNHINSVVKTCNYHIRNLYSIRKFLDQDCLITLVHSLIVSRVDYCNSLYLGLPNYLLKKLQSIMNKSARLIFSVAPRVHITQFLIKLHWLPIKARIEFKICLIVFKALRFGQPKYIADMLSPPVAISHLTLRSDDDPYRLHESRAVGERTFCRKVIFGNIFFGCETTKSSLFSKQELIRSLASDFASAVGNLTTKDPVLVFRMLSTGIDFKALLTSSVAWVSLAESVLPPDFGFTMRT